MPATVVRLSAGRLNLSIADQVCALWTNGLSKLWMKGFKAVVSEQQGRKKWEENWRNCAQLLSVVVKAKPPHWHPLSLAALLWLGTGLP